MSERNAVHNEYGETVLLTQTGAEASVQAALTGGETPAQIANAFIEGNLRDLGLERSRMEADENGLSEANGSPTPSICYSHERDVLGSTVVVYDQMVMGLPIFDARIGVHIDSRSNAVTSAQSSMHAQVQIVNVDQKVDMSEPKSLSKTALGKIVPSGLSKPANGQIARQVVYRFEPDQRVEEHDHSEGGCFGGEGAAVLEVPPLEGTYTKGAHYIVNEVLFEASRGADESPVNWRALVDPASGEILYLRALVANATGLIYQRDPQTQTGANVNGNSSSAVLNPFRSSVPLPGVTPATPQPLEGEYVRIAETSAPVIPGPVGANIGAAFNFDVRSDNFSAVNAYFHSDRCFRTLQEYGFDVFSYFGGTTFPVPVDHRALGTAVNAQAPGNAAGNGLGELRFALVATGQPPGSEVGIATSNRVVWHEFGHALLWDHVNSPNFGFAHSAGDALAAILNDPGTNEPDRGLTFPWVGLTTRRHDRTVGAGWAWFGPNYNTQYNGEQVLSSTLFRLYQSLGGDSTQVNRQRQAAEAVTYLIFKAIGTLTATTQVPEVFVSALQNADLTTPAFKGVPGGALHKVIRWAFEKQGLFQPGAGPGQGNNVNTEGDPPNVDVYIDDGRNGEYQYQANHWSCQDMWVRRNPDGGLAHQQPIVGQANYMYVRVKNRGLQTAHNVTVDAYHALPGTGLAFPDDWAPMNTPSAAAAGPIPQGGSTIVGPFEFVPTQVGHECLLAIAHADGDPGNDTTINGTIAESRLVPFDNNIGQRNVSPVFPNWKFIFKLLQEHWILIRNPFRIPVVCTIDITLPRFLQELGWRLRVASPGGAKFELGPRDKREVVFTIERGEDFGDDVVKRAIARGDNVIEVTTSLNGELSGGMTYVLSYDADEGDDDDRPGPTDDKPPRELPRPLTIEEILRILRGGRIEVPGRLPGGRIRTVRIELDLEDAE